VTLRDVVITGVGAVTPLGVGARTLHERWTAGVSGIRDGEAPCADFDPTDHMSSKQARRADRSTQLAIAAGVEALADAGWEEELPYDPELIGCVLGTGIGGIATLEDNHDQLRDTGPGSVSPLAIPLMMSNAGSAALSLHHGLRGPVFSVVSACAAGSHAIGTALRMIQHGEAEAVVTGAAEAPLTPLSRACFGKMGALSPSGVSRPFDARRDGFVMGEGSGVLVLEAGDAARARGAGRHDAEDGSLQAVAQRQRGRAGVAHHERDRERRDVACALVAQRVVVALERADAADAGAEHAADPKRVVWQFVVPAGHRQRLVGGDHAELREAVRAACLLL